MALLLLLLLLQAQVACASYHVGSISKTLSVYAAQFADMADYNG